MRYQRWRWCGRRLEAKRGLRGSHEKATGQPRCQGGGNGYKSTPPHPASLVDTWKDCLVRERLNNICLTSVTPGLGRGRVKAMIGKIGIPFLECKGQFAPNGRVSYAEQVGAESVYNQLCCVPLCGLCISCT